MKVNDKTLPGITMAFIALFLFVVLLLSTAVTGDTDSLTHYLFARYAFAHPDNFLVHWAKPLFTILSAPFAQFGYTGAIVFNLVCGALTAWLVYKIARKLLYDYSWVVLLMVVFTPVYIITMYTSLTEILFSLVLVFAIYLFVSERYILSAVVISLIPFARTEGLLFLPLFLVALLWMRQYKAVPFLLSGFIFFSMLGIPVYNDFWWFFTKMPYGQKGSDLYGSGSFFYYLGRLNRIMGFPLIILALTGTLTMAKWFVSERKLLRDAGWTTEYILILPSFFGYILLQSFLWWRGMLGVLASDRFMASVLPLGAFLALAGFNVIINNLSFNRVTRNRIGAIIMVSILIMPFVYYKIPFVLKKPYIALNGAAEWIKRTPYIERQIFTYDPSVAFFLEIDPFKKTNLNQYAIDPVHPEKDLGNSDILFWESHFAGSEGDLEFLDLFYNEHFRLLNVFLPGKNIKATNEHLYFVALFERVDEVDKKNDFVLLQKLDYEESIPDPHEKNRTLLDHFSPDHSYQLQPESFGNAVFVPLSEFPDDKISVIRVSGKVKLEEGFPEKKCILVMEVKDKDDHLVRYLTAKNERDLPDMDGWIKLSIMILIDTGSLPDGKIALYTWNQSGHSAFVDDLEIEYLPLEERTD